jgi:sec-independent protein translocase protein TatA
MSMIRGYEWLIILLVVLILFGPSRLPGLARSIGDSIKEFRKASKDEEGGTPSDGTDEPR